MCRQSNHKLSGHAASKCSCLSVSEVMVQTLILILIVHSYWSNTSNREGTEIRVGDLPLVYFPSHL